jgi:hypothetical protein
MGLSGSDPLADLLGQTKRRPAPAQVTAAVVTRSDSTGVWVTPTGGDATHPIGPCRGLTTRLSINFVTPSATAVQLPQGTAVIMVNTNLGPFVVSYDGGPLG